jgi:hypothetical protein
MSNKEGELKRGDGCIIDAQPPALEWKNLQQRCVPNSVPSVYIQGNCTGAKGSITSLEKGREGHWCFLSYSLSGLIIPIIPVKLTCKEIHELAQSHPTQAGFPL